MSLDLRASNQILAIMVFLIVCYVSVWILVKKRSKQGKLKKRLHEDHVGSSNNIIDKIKEKESQNNFFEKIEKEIKQAHSSLTVQGYFVIMAISVMVITFVAYKILGMFILALFVGFLGIIVPKIALKEQGRKFKEKFDYEMINALRRMSAVLRSGGSLENALTDVVNSKIIPEMVRKEFLKVLVTYKGGFSISEAFYQLYENIGSPDTLYLCIAVDIQMETGGDKAEVFDGIASAISNRNLKNKHIKAKLAEVNVSTNVLCLAPIPFAIAIYIYNPHHFDFFKATIGGRLIGLGMLGFMIFGFFIIKKLSRIEY